MSDLTLNHADGYARQTDLSLLVSYDGDYFNKCLGYEDTAIGDTLNACRNALVQRHYGDGWLVDIGIGSGAFIKSRPKTLGTDINPVALEWLHSVNLLASGFSNYKAFTLWDVIEHMPDPSKVLNQMPVDSMAFFSIPVFRDLHRIKESKHYRPGEHLHYWTRSGFVHFMLRHGFYLLEMNDDETLAGREGIASFAFVKVF